MQQENLNSRMGNLISVNCQSHTTIKNVKTKLCIDTCVCCSRLLNMHSTKAVDIVYTYTGAKTDKWQSYLADGKQTTQRKLNELIKILTVFMIKIIKSTFGIQTNLTYKF